MNLRPADLAPVLVLAWMSGASVASAQDGAWRVTTDLWGNTVHQTLTLNRTGQGLSGDLDGDRLEGRVQPNRRISFTATDKDGALYQFEGEADGERLTGFTDQPDPNHPERRARHSFTAQRLPERTTTQVQTHLFAPTRWSNLFSQDLEPALFVWPGDTLRTTTLDSGGVDGQGITRALFGNPQTGPFYVVGARPGDVLAVRIRRLTLNRDYADSLDGVVGRAQTPAVAAQAAGLGRRVRWNLDRQAGVARLADAPEALRDFSIPLRPMLGGMAVAPGFGSAPVSTGDTTRAGGNMDFNAITEGATVYLPVMQPGALLYVGDGHAAQGDGETTQWALETSLEVEVEVNLIPQRPLATPRVENDTEIMALGQAGSLDDATRSATAGLIQWLQQDYGLSLSEASLVIGAAVEYGVENLAGRSVGVSARLPKSALAGLKPKS